MIVAVDDIGIGDVEGFTLFATSTNGAAAFRADANAILRAHGLAHFHGREFQPAHRAAYEEFCDLIRRTLERHGGLAAFHLMPRHLFSEIFEQFSERVSNNVVQNLGNPGSATTALMSTKAGAVVWLTRFTQRVVRPSTMDVLIAREQLQDDSLNTDLVVIPAGLVEPAADLLLRIGDGYARQVFPGGPRISSLRLVDANVDPIVQAADVIGNFGINFAKATLRVGSASTVTEAAKAQIFSRAFDGGGVIPAAARADYSVTAQNTIAVPPTAGPLRFELLALEE